MSTDQLERIRRLAAYVQPGRAFPLTWDPETCPDCRGWTMAAADPNKAERMWQALADHATLHRIVRDVLYVPPPGDPFYEYDQGVARSYVWDVIDRHGAAGRLVEPSEGTTDFSKAFYVLHRHRFGEFVLATMVDFEERLSVTLTDDAGWELELRGCTSGYSGTGCQGTIWILRMAGFTDQDAAAHGYPIGGLERLVCSQRAFTLRRAP